MMRIEPIERAGMLSLLIMFSSPVISKTYNFSRDMTDFIALCVVIAIMSTGITIEFIEKKRGGK